MEKINLTKQEKIILVISEISNLKQENIKFEDIVVALYKKFPNDFHLKGHKNYPDSGDSVKRALYTLRDRGFLYVNNMIFKMTDKGIDFGEKMINSVHGIKIIEKDNLDRYIINEINRIKKLEGFALFLSGEREGIFDTDFYNYLGITARTEKSDFLGRFGIIKETMEKISNYVRTEPSYRKILEYHEYLINKFRNIIDYNLGK
ncbi:MAG: hypothetical protein NTY11_01890 [Candidatus Parcubacteria bacterium]|nr:hypothetical protein [Candidatus Parcubacteria bacterium]